MLCNHTSYADKLVHSALLGQFADDGVEFVGFLSALLYVAENQCAFPPVVVRPSAHEVECDVERA